MTTIDAPTLPEPATLEEAERRLDDLWLDIRSITIQLADRSRLDKHGLPVDEAHHARWRRSAEQALALKQAQYRAAQTWIRQYYRANPALAREQETTRLLGLLYTQVCDWLKQGLLPAPGASTQHLLDQIDELTADTRADGWDVV